MKRTDMPSRAKNTIFPIRPAALIIDETFKIYQSTESANLQPSVSLIFEIVDCNNDILVFKDLAHRQRLQQVIDRLKSAPQKAQPEFLVLRPKSGGMLILHVIPLSDYFNEKDRNGESRLLGFLLVWRHFTGAREMNFDALRREFRLTRAEALVFEAIGRGMKISEFAKSKGIAHETARNQLRRLALKLKVVRQAEIAALYCELTQFTSWFEFGHVDNSINSP